MVFPIIQEAVKVLTDQVFTVTQGDPFRQCEQQGDSDWITVTFPTGTAVKSAGMVAKRPRVLFHHAKDMQKEYEYKPHIAQYKAKAICNNKVTSNFRENEQNIYSVHPFIFQHLGGAFFKVRSPYRGKYRDVVPFGKHNNRSTYRKPLL